MTCNYCETDFIVAPSVIRNGRKYCSKQCANKALVGKEPWMKGRKHTEETRKKISIAKLKNPTRYWLGKTKSAEIRKNISIGHLGINVGEEHVNWRGEDANYFTKHAWMTRHYGQPRECERCKTTEAKAYHWANISGKYMRVREDWIRLCQSCHFKMDDVANRGWIKRRAVTVL